MIKVFLVVVLGATLFSEQNIPGLRVGAMNPLSGKYSVNYRHVDLNQDGKKDLVFANKTILQVGSKFDIDNVIKNPAKSAGGQTDIFARTLYHRSPGTLEIFPWQDSRWGLPTTLNVDWPDMHTLDGAGGIDDVPGEALKSLSRFLHDLDEDGKPEIVISDSDGLHIFTLSGNNIKKAALLTLFPTPRASGVALSPVWPQKSRRIQYPTRVLNFRLFIEGPNITFVRPGRVVDGLVRYSIDTYRVDPQDGFQPLKTATSSIQTEPLPAYFRPCRLNTDAQIDFAGTKRRTAEIATFPVPIFEVAATLDGARSLRTVRTKSYRSRCSFVDIDSDGDLDLISETTRILEGGIREAFTQFMTRKEIQHQVNVYLQDGTFESSPSIQQKVSIKLDQFPFRQSAMFDRYQAGELIDLTGDFDGDGHNDLLVQDRPEHLAIHFWTGDRFEKKSSLGIPIRPHWRYGIEDVDQDGRSDIAMKWRNEENGTAESGLVFFSREDSP